MNTNNAKKKIQIELTFKILTITKYQTPTPTDRETKLP